jgi:hypothetical protein
VFEGEEIRTQAQSGGVGGMHAASENKILYQKVNTY